MNNINLATIDNTGIKIADLQTVTTFLQQQFQTVYGSTINIDSNTQAGQEIGIFAQIVEDLLQFAVQVFNTFDPTSVIGIQQDNLYAINGIQRQGATYTYQNIQITVNQSLTLQGLDADINNPNGIGFTVSDNAGNQFILANTTNLLSGTTTLEFRAALLGSIITTPNTITNPVTVILGVTNINNSTGATVTGLSEEPDSLFRARQQQSVAIPSIGNLDGLQGALLNLTGVTDAIVYENVYNTTDSNGIPAHSIWCIVEGGNAQDIVQTIYTKLTLGAGTKGSITKNITTDSGQIITFGYDTPIAENLYIKFTIQTLITGTNFNTTAITAYIANNLDYKINQVAETSSITTIAIAAITSVNGINSGVPLDIQISIDNSTWTDYLIPTAITNIWSISANNIFITVVS